MLKLYHISSLKVINNNTTMTNLYCMLLPNLIMFKISLEPSLKSIILSRSFRMLYRIIILIEDSCSFLLSLSTRYSFYTLVFSKHLSHEITFISTLPHTHTSLTHKIHRNYHSICTYKQKHNRPILTSYRTIKQYYSKSKQSCFSNILEYM